MISSLKEDEEEEEETEEKSLLITAKSHTCNDYIYAQ